MEDRRYIVGYNPQEAAKDAADRQAILKALEDKLKQGPKSMVGNPGLSPVPEGGAGRGESRCRQGGGRSPF